MVPQADSIDALSCFPDSQTRQLLTRVNRTYVTLKVFNPNTMFIFGQKNKQTNKRTNKKYICISILIYIIVVFVGK